MYCPFLQVGSASRNVKWKKILEKIVVITGWEKKIVTAEDVAGENLKQAECLGATILNVSENMYQHHISGPLPLVKFGLTTF